MLHATPETTPAIQQALDAVDELGARLHDHRPPERWLSVLRRSARGEAAASSVAIEGFHVDAGAAAALVAGERRASGAGDEAVAAYGRAMDHVVAFADDPLFKWNHRVIADLHFDLAWPDPASRPGRVRDTPMGITDAAGALAYTAPDPAQAKMLLAELVTWLRKGDLDAPVVVRAAMAHLHLVSIHPFADGNGRASRVLQSLVLALGGQLAPELASIESYLHRNTEAYYAALQAAHGAAYDPTLSAAPWVEFCATAHAETARARVDQIGAATRRWSAFERLARERRWPNRLVIAMEQASVDQLDRTRYAGEAGVSPATASADLRRLVDAGFIGATGSGPNTRYRATPALRALTDS
jgi:Fic family protein